MELFVEFPIPNSGTTSQLVFIHLLLNSILFNSIDQIFKF